MNSDQEKILKESIKQAIQVVKKKKSLQENKLRSIIREFLKVELKKAPKVLRTCRHNKHPIVMNPSYIDHFEEYKMIGIKNQNK